jgi:CBS domain containing-hemolysin-like protein
LGKNSAVIKINSVEELFGEIEDEHDSVDLIEEKMDDKTFKFSARLEVDYINETYKINLPENENYETLGGLVVNHTQEIPAQNDIVRIDTFQFTILEVSNTKIDMVELKVLEED